MTVIAAEALAAVRRAGTVLNLPRIALSPPGVVPQRPSRSPHGGSPRHVGHTGHTRGNPVKTAAKELVPNTPEWNAAVDLLADRIAADPREAMLDHVFALWPDTDGPGQWTESVGALMDEAAATFERRYPEVVARMAEEDKATAREERMDRVRRWMTAHPDEAAVVWGEYAEAAGR